MSKNSKMSRAEWLLLVLLVASVFINYIDRSNLSMAAPLLEKELALSPYQIGTLLSAFFWTYSLMQLFGIAGWLADRFPVGIVFALGFLAWSAATAVTGFLSGFPSIYAARLVLGVGESVAYPCYSRIFATHVPQQQRGRANALIDAGTKLGPALGTFVAGVLLVRFGWRVFFITLGIGSLLWLLPWFKYMPRTTHSLGSGQSRLPSLLELLAQRSAWGSFIGIFCGNYFWYFLLTWIPIYLVKERSLSIQGMANLTSLLFLVVAACTVTTGWISDRLIVRGLSPTRVRKAVVVAGLAVASTILPVAFIPSRILCISFLFLACAGYGVYASNHWAIAQTLAGPVMAGRWTSVANGIANLSGIIAPWVAGFVVQRNGSSQAAFIVVAAITASGALVWGLIVERIEPVHWSRGSAGSAPMLS